MSVLEPQEEDRQYNVLDSSKQISRKREFYGATVCNSTMFIKYSKFAFVCQKKKKQEMLIFVGPEVLLCHNLTPARLMVNFFFYIVPDLVLAFRHHYSIFHL